MRWFLQFLTGSHTQPCKSRRPCAGKIMRSCQHDVQECFAASRSSKYKPPRQPAKTASTATTASSSSSCARTANHCHHHCHHHHHQNHYNDNGSNRNSWVVRDGSESYEIASGQESFWQGVDGPSFVFTWGPSLGPDFRASSTTNTCPWLSINP